MEQEDINIYDSIDEVLAAPPARIYQWGNTILFAIVTLTIIVLSLIKYTETMELQASVINLDEKKIISPPFPAQVIEIFRYNDTNIIKGQALVSIKEKGSGKIDTLRSPANGTLKKFRLIKNGDLLPPNTTLYSSLPANPALKITLFLKSEDQAGQIFLGQQFTISGVSGRPALNAEIISLPYVNPDSKKICIDAAVDKNKNFSSKNVEFGDLSVANIALGKSPLLLKIFR